MGTLLICNKYLLRVNALVFNFLHLCDQIAICVQGDTCGQMMYHLEQGKD